ncbi:MAG: GtrA family protein [Kiritimatiellae bacterium]|nr:GtrA family protein [Kiritimatiellia bacterium]
MEFIRRFLSHDAGPLAQFVKYGAIGVLTTLVQLSVFSLLAATWLKCLTPDDLAVKLLGLPSATFSGAEPWYAARWFLAAVATAVGFTISNVICWILNRTFVFRPGKFRWFVELGMFFGAAASATVIALGVQSVLIKYAGMMTSTAVVLEVVVSFVINFVVRKFFIFKG